MSGMLKIASLALIVAAGRAHADSEIWRNDWFLPAPPTLSPESVPVDGRIAFAANGDVVIGGLGYVDRDFQFTRIGVDGTVRWSANVGYTLNRTPLANELIATDDGGALVAVGDAYVSMYEGVIRIDASGRIAWMHEVPAQAAAVGGGRAFALGCSSLIAYDDATGAALWQRPTDICYGTVAIAADGSGGAIIVEQAADEPVRVMHYAADGTIAWSAQVAGFLSGGQSVFGPANGLVIVNSYDRLTAFRVADGAIAWSLVGYYGVQLAGSPPEPIVYDATSISRLDAATGTPRWTVPSIEGIYAAAASADALVFGVPTHAVTRIDLATGATLWTMTPPFVDGFGNTLHNVGLGGFSGDAFSVVEQPATDANVPPFVQRVALADGSLAGMTPMSPVPQAPASDSFGDGDRIVGVQDAQTTAGPELRLRRLAAASGAADWQIDDPIALDPLFYSVPTRVSSQASVIGDGIAVATSLSIGQYFAGAGLRVAYYDRATGARRWEQFFGDSSDAGTYEAAPVAAADGDLFVASGASAFCSRGIYPDCAWQALSKLSRTDGHVLWRIEDRYDWVAGDAPFPNELVAVGDDAILLGPFEEGFSPDTLRSIAGANGAVQWASSIFGYRRILAVYPADGDVLVVANGDGWAKLDHATGAPIWVGPAFPAPCFSSCGVDATFVVLPGGDILTASQTDFKAGITRLHNDGSGTYESWTIDPDATQRTLIVNLAVDSDGGVWIYLLRNLDHATTAGVAVLAKFDPATGRLTRQQIVRGRSPEPLQGQTLGSWIGAPEGERLVLESTTTEPSLPTVGGNVVLDTHVTASGDIATTLDVDRGYASTGETVTFHARLAYTGTSAIAGAHLAVYLPWGSGARNVVCAPTNAGACAVDTSGDSVRATMDLSPGATVDLTGEVLVLAADWWDTSAAYLTAVSWGPLSLDEPDTRNNLAQRAVDRGIFGDGFDGD